MRSDSLATQERAFEIDLHHEVPILLGHFKERSEAGDAGIANKDVDAAKSLDGHLDHPLNLRLLRDVGHGYLSFAT